MTDAFSQDDHHGTDGTPPDPRSSEQDAEGQHAAFDGLLEYLRRTRGLDLTGYKTASLTRRLEKRMVTLGVEEFAAFIDYLEVHPEEFRTLFNELLINVTGFFRDGEAWAELSRQVLEPLVARRSPSDRIRVWSAGCATGEEAYTLAISLAEVMGPEAFKARVKIYATDADEPALAHARQGTYDERALTELAPELRERYFERTRDGRYTFRTDLRRALIFGRHDLMYDAPISRIDVLACRNVLMYFNAEMQSRILGRFALALNDSGILFLGRAETLLSRTTLFAPVDLRRRLFARSRAPALRDRLHLVKSESPLRTGDGHLQQPRARDAAFDASPVAQIVVEADGTVSQANAHARALFQLTPADVGRSLQDLELSYRPLELRSRVDEVHRSQRAVTVSGVVWGTPLNSGGTCDVVFAPLADEAGSFLGVNISFLDTTRHSRLQRELEHANQELETAYEELQSTNEELETTNEELQSAVEELETTNEELQSTNEELETMNEELQSTNEELQTINDALRNREHELDELAAFLQSVLSSLDGAVIAFDRDLRITAWNSLSEEHWGLRAEEVMGRNFFTLDIGLPAEALHAPIRAALAGESPPRLQIRGTNRRGKPLQCEVTCVSMRRDDEIRGVLLRIEDCVSVPAEESLAAS